MCPGRKKGAWDAVRFQWSSESIRWYREAAEYGDFHRNIAKLLRTCVEGADSLCDLGCGLGYLDAELSPWVARIEALDICREAVISLGNMTKARKIRNIFPVCGDWEARLDGERPQIALLSFFGNLNDERQFRRVYAFPRSTLIYITNTDRKSNLSPSGISRREKACGEQFSALLERLDIPYISRRAELEFGQPFASRGDAEAFVEYYYPGCTAAERKEFLCSRLERRDGGYYLPNQKSLEIFIFYKEEEQ